VASYAWRCPPILSRRDRRDKQLAVVVAVIRCGSGVRLVDEVGQPGNAGLSHAARNAGFLAKRPEGRAEPAGKHPPSSGWRLFLSRPTHLCTAETFNGWLLRAARGCLRAGTRQRPFRSRSDSGEVLPSLSVSGVIRSAYSLFRPLRSLKHGSPPGGPPRVLIGLGQFFVWPGYGVIGAHPRSLSAHSLIEERDRSSTRPPSR